MSTDRRISEGQFIHTAGNQQFAVGHDELWGKGSYNAKLVRGGKVSKQPAGVMYVREWEEQPTPYVSDVAVSARHQRKGLASAMMQRAVEDYPNLSHSRHSLSMEGALTAMANPLPGDDDKVKAAIGHSTKPLWSAANSMLGGPT